MRYSLSTAAVLLAGNAIASPFDAAPLLQKRACSAIHIFGARETTVPQSQAYGSSSTVVNGLLSAYPGSTSEAIVYPACGGQSSCGSISYADSVKQGISAVATAVNSYNQQCPDSQLVLVGYSQGGQIFDDAYCGGPDTAEGWSTVASPLTASAQAAVKAAIFMGDPRRVNGLSYNVGTCTTQGFAARPSGFSCKYAANIKSYCDSADPYCCTGNDANVHQGYGAEYGQQAIAFVKTKLSATGGGGGGGGGGSTTTTTSRGSVPTTSTTTSQSSNPTSPSGTCAAIYGQCGGQGWTGPTCCSSGTCKFGNSYYSQCL